MKLPDRIRWVFWNKEEARLRMIWRIGVHTVALFALTTAFTLGLLLITLFVDAIFGTGIGQSLTENGPDNFMQVPLIFMVIIPSATFLGVLVATLIVGKYIDRRKFKDFGISFSKSFWVDFAFGLGLGALLMALVFLFGWLSGNFEVTGFFQPLNSDLSFLSGFLQALFLFIFVGIYEELLSRGYHLINLAEGLNVKPGGKRRAVILAVLVSSLVFGLLHSSNPNASVVSTLNITFAGIVFSLAMIFTGSLAIPIGLHITWNFFQGNVFGFPVSGMRNGATIIATEAIGPDWLTGGSFGPEAGVMGLIALIIGGIFILLYIKRHSEIRLHNDISEYHPNKNNDPHTTLSE
ncbi:MAG: CPBP family intramembrane glutamic endopeptidase [Brevefilum sp.]